MAYVNRELAISEMEQVKKEHSFLPKICIKAIDVAINAFKIVPTADVEEVVRCEKCKHWRKMGYDPILEKDFGHCYNNDFPFMCETRPDTDEDDFCSYGERKTVTDTNVGGK